MNGWLPNMHFHLGDAHDNDELDAMLSSQPVFMFIDADKLFEVHRFAPLLRPGSMFVVHDFWSEVFYADIEAVLREHKIFMLYEDVADAVRSHARVFLVVGDTPISIQQPQEGTANMYLPRKHK